MPEHFIFVLYKILGLRAFLRLNGHAPDIFVYCQAFLFRDELLRSLQHLLQSTDVMGLSIIFSVSILDVLSRHVNLILSLFILIVRARIVIDSVHLKTLLRVG